LTGCVLIPADRRGRRFTLVCWSLSISASKKWRPKCQCGWGYKYRYLSFSGWSRRDFDNVGSGRTNQSSRWTEVQRSTLKRNVIDLSECAGLVFFHSYKTAERELEA